VFFPPRTYDVTGRRRTGATQAHAEASAASDALVIKLRWTESSSPGLVLGKNCGVFGVFGSWSAARKRRGCLDHADASKAPAALRDLFRVLEPKLLLLGLAEPASSSETQPLSQALQEVNICFVKWIAEFAFCVACRGCALSATFLLPC